MKSVYQKTFSGYEESQLIFQDSMALVNTILPAKIISVNYPKVTVQPQIKRVFIDANDVAQYIDYPEIPDLPVLNFGNPSVNIIFPAPQVGDIGILLVCQSQVSSVYNRSEENSTRKFDLMDGLFIPFFMNSAANESGQIKINASKTTITSPKFTVTGEAGELVSALKSALTTIKGMKAVNGVNLYPMDPASQAAIQAQIDVLNSFL